MKKLSIFLLGALAFAATSCEDGPSVPPVQANPQGPVYAVDGVTVEAPSITVFDLAPLAEVGEDIPVANFVVSELPEGCTLKTVAYFSKDESFSSSREIAGKLTDNTFYITPEDFQNTFVSVMGKNPAAADVYLRYAAYAVTADGQEYRLGNENSFLGPLKYTVTPFPSDVVIEDAYYLLGTINGWDVATAIKLNHSDADVYDDPVFSIAVDITEEEANSGWWWKIIPQSTYEAGTWVDATNSSFGPEENGDESMSGVLYGSVLDENGDYHDSQAGMLSEYGTFLLTINMIDGTFDFQLAIPELYVQGQAANWDWASPLVATLVTSNYSDYYGASKCATGGYKFTSEKSWEAPYDLGFGEATTPSDGYTLAGTLLNHSSSNIVPENDGLYWHHVNLTAMTFESMYITTLGVIGNATPGGWDASTALTPSEDCLVWEGDIEFAADGEWKIRANDAWVFSLGGDMNDLGWDNAPNMPSPGAGVKHVKLDLSSHPYTVTVQ